MFLKRTRRHIDPFHDDRWPELIRKHPASSVFHRTQWLSVLRAAHGYEAVVYTSCPPSVELWTAIRQAKAAGYTRFDLGRTAISNAGLMTFFKERWGGVGSDLNYWRYPNQPQAHEFLWTRALMERIATVGARPIAHGGGTRFLSALADHPAL